MPKSLDSLLEYLGADVTKLPDNARALNVKMQVFETSQLDSSTHSSSIPLFTDRSYRIDLLDASGVQTKSIGQSGTLASGQVWTSLAGLAGKSVRLQVRPIGPLAQISHLMVTVGNVYDLPSSDATLGKTIFDDRESTPDKMALSEAYPNPFNPNTVIKYQLSTDSRTSLIIYDVLGREVATLANGMMAAGFHSETWNAQNCASGMYFARLVVTDAVGKQVYAKTAKLLLMK